MGSPSTTDAIEADMLKGYWHGNELSRVGYEQTGSLLMTSGVLYRLSYLLRHIFEAPRSASRGFKIDRS